MPRKNYSSDRTPTFACDQRRTMVRHIAGVFSARSGTIIVHGDVEDGLLGMLIERAHPLQGMKRRSHAHVALVTEVYETMIRDGRIHLGDSEATMSAKFMEKQMGVSRLLRDRAAAAKQKRPYVDRRSSRRQALGVTI